MIRKGTVTEKAEREVEAAIVREDAGRVEFIETLAANSERHGDLAGAIRRTIALEDAIDLGGYPSPNISHPI